MKTSLITSIVVGANCLLAVSGCHQSEHGRVAPTQQEFLLPREIFAHEEIVYALDSNKDTLEVIFPNRSVEQLGFDLPPLSAYRRDTVTEWIVTRPGVIYERKIGTKNWSTAGTNSQIRYSIYFEGSLYIEQRFSGQDLVKVSRFREGKIEKSWTTAYSGIGRSSPPTFLDEHGNLAMIKDGDKAVLLKSEELPFDKAHDFNNVFVIGWLRGTAFAVQSSSLYTIRGQAASTVDLKNVNWMAIDVGGGDAWAVGTRANRTIAARYTDGTWSEADVGGALPGTHSIFSAGERACIVTHQDGGKYYITTLFAQGEKIIQATTTSDIKLFATEYGVVHAGGFWWISPRDPGELVQLDDGSPE